MLKIFFTNTFISKSFSIILLFLQTLIPSYFCQEIEQLEKIVTNKNKPIFYNCYEDEATETGIEIPNFLDCNEMQIKWHMEIKNVIYNKIGTNKCRSILKVLFVSENYVIFNDKLEGYQLLFQYNNKILKKPDCLFKKYLYKKYDGNYFIVVITSERINNYYYTNEDNNKEYFVDTIWDMFDYKNISEYFLRLGIEAYYLHSKENFYDFESTTYYNKMLENFELLTGKKLIVDIDEEYEKYLILFHKNFMNFEYINKTTYENYLIKIYRNIVDNLINNFANEKFKFLCEERNLKLSNIAKSLERKYDFYMHVIEDKLNFEEERVQLYLTEKM
ncbi:Hypothetical protein SRAE_X000125150 [Strongyloides ratti]|uniref:Uncharacterized protein n=1 Tax=Strongyloides ratti TaxID=34506 RepID=A0A090KQ46_STRRB|nr:Hypothetical protein SRAE_X000125150 [Strongyloides ratti]CEF59504.1 Hypothetical protein SRAE_X000125150 [Strongyloides ratti]